MSLRGKLKDEISHFTENQASHKFPTGFYIFQVGDRGGGRAGHSVLTEPISSVLRFSEKFGSSKIGTDRFFLGSRTEQFRFRLVRFGSGTNRTNRSNLKIVSHTMRRCGPATSLPLSSRRDPPPAQQPPAAARAHHHRPPNPARGADLVPSASQRVGGWGRACRGPARAWGSPTRRGRATRPAGRAAGAARGAGAAAARGRGGGRRRRAPRRWRPSRRPRCPARRPGSPPPITGRTATPRSKVGGWAASGWVAFSSTPCAFRFRPLLVSFGVGF